MAREHSHQGHGDKPPPGVHDLSGPAPSPGGKKQAAHTGFFRVRVFLPANPEPGSPNHVVTARDDIEAEAKCFRELGIRSVDKSVNSVEITTASEADFIEAQAKRQSVDLREMRKKKQADGTELPEEAPDYGKLTWSPPGYKLQKDYWVSDVGELTDKKPAPEDR